MSTQLDDPPNREETAAVERLRSEMIALRLSFTWFGTRKTLSPAQKARAAESFGAQGAYLSAGKKLLDTKHPRFQAVTAVRTRALAYVKGMSLPYPEPGLRLIRQADLTPLTERLAVLQQELTEAVAELARHYDDLQAAARERLGELFHPADYPATLQGLFGMTWEFPSVEPPEYLRQLSPDLYARECRRMQSRFSEALQLAEQAFLEELAKLVDHLVERLSGADDGTPKVFRNSAVDNLTAFFDRFQRLNVRSNAELEALVERARAVVGDLPPQRLRENPALRQQVATQLSGVQSLLDGLLVDRPRRRVLR